MQRLRQNGKSSASSEPSILFISPGRWVPFIDHDIEILRRHFHVDVLIRPDFSSRSRLLLQILRLLATRRYSLIYIWFADPFDTPYIVLLGRLFAVPSIVVVGGYELTYLPAVGYGALTSRRYRLQLKIALRLAHTLLPTSEFLAQEIRSLVRTSRIHVLPPGIDCGFFTPGAGERERLAVTVARITWAQWKVKGLDIFAAASRLLPDASFVIIGPCEDDALARKIQDLGGDNLRIIGRNHSPSEILAWYQRAAVYAQLSARESFGVAVAEAMACACVPVTTNVGALPHLMDGTGILVAYGDPAAAARAIETALSLPPADDARQRVQKLFYAGRREEELPLLLGEVVSSGSRGGGSPTRSGAEVP